jgi:hypothetical protein
MITINVIKVTGRVFAWMGGEGYSVEFSSA